MTRRFREKLMELLHRHYNEQQRGWCRDCAALTIPKPEIFKVCSCGLLFKPRVLSATHYGFEFGERVSTDSLYLRVQTTACRFCWPELVWSLQAEQWARKNPDLAAKCMKESQ